MTEAHEIVERGFDVVIVGAGGSGMRVALGNSCERDVRVIRGVDRKS